jgi:hypothetical protein
MPFTKSLFCGFSTSFGIHSCCRLTCTTEFFCCRIAGRKPDYQERDQQDSE